MLNRVRFKNIKALADVELALDRFLVLVGPNACGKSTLLDQIKLLCEMSAPEPEHRFVLGRANEVVASLETDELRTRGGAGPMVWQGESEELELSVQLLAGKGGLLNRMKVQARVGEKDLSLLAEDQKARQEFEAILPAWQATRLTLVPGQLALPSLIRFDMDPGGGGLAALLATIGLNDTDARARIEEDLRKLVPDFRGLQFKPVSIEAGGGNVEHGFALRLKFAAAGEIPAHLASDGTLIALGVLATLHARHLPGLLLIDDIDHGLHLNAQLQLIRAIKVALDSRPDLRVICTTHSPYMLSEVSPEEVCVMALDGEGHSVIRRLTEHPDIARWRTAMTTGELWANLGEEWVVGGS